jgi:transcriptional regulator with XRE-family HTH domain
MKKIPASLGGRIRELRGDLTQSEFAQLLDIKQAMVSRYEADKEMPSPPILLRLAQFSGRPMEWLLTGKEGDDLPARRVGARLSQRLSQADLLTAAGDYLRHTQHPLARPFQEMMENAFRDRELMQKLLDYFQYLKFQGKR